MTPKAGLYERKKEADSSRFNDFVMVDTHTHGFCREDIKNLNTFCGRLIKDNTHDLDDKEINLLNKYFDYVCSLDDMLNYLALIVI